VSHAAKPVFPPLEADSWPIARQWSRLDDLCEGVFDCPHTTPVITDEGPYVVRSQDVRTGIFRLDQAAHVSEETYQERIARAEPRFGDILYSREGTYFGLAAEVPRGVRVCLGQRMVLIRPSDKIDTRFLRLWLNSPVLHRHIMGFRDGTVAERLNMPTIRGLPVPHISLAEQRAIAATLGALDDKIELNRKMNATLEAMARALFRDWFVDFGPTSAKMEARAPYLSPDLWSLFPDRLDDEGKPEGWEVSTIGDEVRVVGGSTPSTKEPDLWDGGINWATPKDLSNLAAPVLLETSRTITEAGLAKISSGQLPVGALLLSSRAPIGYLAIAEVPVAINQGFIGMICDKRISNVFAWLWTLENMDAILAKANGSTFQEISKGNFRPLPVVVPSEPVLRAFDAIAKPLYDRIAKNERESRTLAQIRDLLLPRLMSGEVRVANVDSHRAEQA
jgi:type I restriction enzyme S subunit